jgi:hypothetical protein
VPDNEEYKRTVPFWAVYIYIWQAYNRPDSDLEL